MVATYSSPSLSNGAERTAPPRSCQTAFSGERARCCPCPHVRALSPSSVGQSRRELGRVVAVVVMSAMESEKTMVDLLQVADAEAEFSGRRNVSRLPKEQILRSVVKKNVGIRGDAAGIVFPHRRGAVFATFLLDRLQFNRVHRNRVRRNHQDPRLVDEILDLRERAAMPNLPHAVHDMQH